MSKDDGKVQPRRQSDSLFAEPKARLEDFNFGHDTAMVFDDMLERSVPFYTEIQTMVSQLAGDYARPGTAIYDLGCSTCSSFLQIDPILDDDADVRFVGIDSSEDMLERGRAKLEEHGFKRPFELFHRDMNQGVEIENASVVLMVLTLQFVRPLRRQKLIRDVYAGMVEGGCLLLVEKVLGEHSTFNRLFIQHYYEMKRRNGYSEMEIAQKREALENVLVPYRLEENKQLLREEGFEHLDVFFKWYNFCGIVAMK